MDLYTINETYPDRHFNFTITADTVGGNNVVHTHSISDITSLSQTLNNLPNQATAIIIDGEMYIRDEINDDAEMYAWTNNASGVTYKTATLTPNTSTNVYNTSGNWLDEVSISMFVTAHTHICVDYLVGNDQEIVYGDVVLSSNIATITIVSSNITINYVSPQTGNVAGIFEHNQNDAIGIFQIYHGDIRDIPEGVETNILAI